MDRQYREKAVLNWLDGQQDAMVALLGRLVNIDSGSYNKAGSDTVFAALKAHFDGVGIASELIPLEAEGHNLRALVPAGAKSAGNRPIMLMGHCDTVFADGTAAERPFTVENGRATGPGVNDMKSGVVLNTFVLTAIARAGGAQAPLVGLYTSDEEIASPGSRAVIEAEARNARAVFNSEPARPSGNIVVGRKGAVFFRFEITGKPAHSGVAHDKGVSAIEAMARKVQALHALTDYEIGTTVNVGLIEGGRSVNTVAPFAAAEVDVRFKTLAAMDEIMARVREVVEAEALPGTQARIVREGRFLPFEQTEANRALFEAYRESAQEVGFAVEGEYTGGSADSGFTSALGTPTLCGLGPVGAHSHSEEEFMEVDTLVPRAKALALTVLRLGS
ncbi:MAG: M20 family metallopeptidase [Kiloniellales bacterium]|nr:M20 family metallopeptidase [Kiloniellales bacterium]